MTFLPDQTQEPAYVEIPLWDKNDDIVAFAIISPEDEAKVAPYRWRLDASGYAVTSHGDFKRFEPNRRGINRRISSMLMHRLVNNTPDGLICDHINRNRLDNRRENLRAVTAQENTWNRPGGRRFDKSEGL